jgi:hypothetical protein
MNKIKYVSVETQNDSPVENFLIQVKKVFVFEGNYFDDCENIEEIRDKFENGNNPDNIYNWIIVKTFTTKKNMENDKSKNYCANER